MKNSLEVFKGRFKQGEERISKLKTGHEAEEHKEKRLKKSEQSLRDLGTPSRSYIHYGTSRRKREKGVKRIFKEIMVENTKFEERRESTHLRSSMKSK